MSLKSKTRTFWFFIFLCFLAAFSMCLYSLWLNQSESIRLIKKDHTSQKTLEDLIALALSDSKKTLTKVPIEVDEKTVVGAAKKIEAFLKERNLRQYYHIKFFEIRKIEEEFLKEKKLASLEAINDILKQMDQGLQKLSQKSYLIISDLLKSYQTILQNYFSQSPVKEDKYRELKSTLSTLKELVEKNNDQLFSHYTELQMKYRQRLYIAIGLCGFASFILILYYLFSMRSLSFFSLTLNNMKENTESLNISIDDAKNSLRELDELTLRQGQTLNETSHSLAKMNTVAEEKNKNVAHSIDLLKENSRNLELVKRAFGKTEKTMSMISQESESLKEIFQKETEELNKVISIIKEIIEKNKVISDIIFQTKLLSFNVSTWAQQTTDVNKGFAAVAEEMGKLTSLSSSASLEISSILEKSISKIEMILQRNENASKTLTAERAARIQEGASQALECLGVLESVSEKEHSIVGHLEKISHSLEEDAHRLNAITIGVSELGSTNIRATELCELSVKEVMKVKNSADALLTYSHKFQRIVSSR